MKASIVNAIRARLVGCASGDSESASQSSESVFTSAMFGADSCGCTCN